MKKKHFHLILSLLLCLFSKNVSAYDIKVPNSDGVTIYYNYINDGTELEVTYQDLYNSEYCENIVIPEEVTFGNRSLKVTKIGNRAFGNCYYDLTSITIPNTVTSIGNYAFLYCYGLTSITIPNSVTSIEEGAFDGCGNLTSVHISDLEAWCRIKFDNIVSNPVHYGGHLYVNGEEIKKIVIPNSLTIIGNYTFADLKVLTSVTIPNSVTSIGECAFRYCGNLTTVSLGNSVTSIGKGAFEQCEKLTSIDIPNSMTTIGQGAFMKCGITSVNIPNSVTNIEDEAFSCCWYLPSIDIPNSVQTIGHKAFFYCPNLTSVKIGNCVTSIGENAFGECTNLKSVHITNLEAWCKIQFGDFDSNPTRWAHHLYLNGEEIKDLVIPETITSINDYAFNGCSKLTSVIIPNSVTSIGTYALSFSSNFTDLYCYAEQVPFTKQYAFSNSICEYATLHVPANSIEAYKNAELWKDFGNIVTLTDDDPRQTGIIATTATQQPTIVGRYDLNGRRISQSQKGLILSE